MTAFTSLFSIILDLTRAGALTILVVLLLRACLRNIPKKYRFLLWAAVLLRLVCPVFPETSFSLMNTREISLVQPPDVPDIPDVPDLPSFPTATSSEEPSPSLGPQTDFTQTESASQNFPAPPEVPAVPDAPGLPEVPDAPDAPDPPPVSMLPMDYFALLWLAGCLGLIASMLINSYRLHRSLATAWRVDDFVWECDAIPGPFIFGIFQPKIYLPAGMSGLERGFVLCHEYAHLARKDYILKPLAFAVLAVHWFNPLVWVAFWLMSKDMEYACDEQVLNQLGQEIKADYSQCLLSFATSPAKLATAPLAFESGDTKGRIRNVLNYKKPALWLLITALIVIAAALAMLLTNPKQSQAVELRNIEFSDSLQFETVSEPVRSFSSPYWGENGYTELSVYQSKLLLLNNTNQLVIFDVETGVSHTLLNSLPSEGITYAQLTSEGLFVFSSVYNEQGISTECFVRFYRFQTETQLELVWEKTHPANRLDLPDAVLQDGTYVQTRKDVGIYALVITAPDGSEKVIHLNGGDEPSSITENGNQFVLRATRNYRTLYYVGDSSGQLRRIVPEAEDSIDNIYWGSGYLTGNYILVEEFDTKSVDRNVDPEGRSVRTAFNLIVLDQNGKVFDSVNINSVDVNLMEGNIPAYFDLYNANTGNQPILYRYTTEQDGQTDGWTLAVQVDQDGKLAFQKYQDDDVYKVLYEPVYDRYLCLCFPDSNKPNYWLQISESELRSPIVSEPVRSFSSLQLGETGYTALSVYQSKLLLLNNTNQLVMFDVETGASHTLFNSTFTENITYAQLTSEGLLVHYYLFDEDGTEANGDGIHRFYRFQTDTQLELVWEKHNSIFLPSVMLTDSTFVQAREDVGIYALVLTAPDGSETVTHLNGGDKPVTFTTNGNQFVLSADHNNHTFYYVGDSSGQLRRIVPETKDTSDFLRGYLAGNYILVEENYLENSDDETTAAWVNNLIVLDQNGKVIDSVNTNSMDATIFESYAPSYFDFYNVNIGNQPILYQYSTAKDGQRSRWMLAVQVGEDGKLSFQKYQDDNVYRILYEPVYDRYLCLTDGSKPNYWLQISAPSQYPAMTVTAEGKQIEASQSQWTPWPNTQPEARITLGSARPEEGIKLIFSEDHLPDSLEYQEYLIVNGTPQAVGGPTSVGVFESYYPFTPKECEESSGFGMESRIVVFTATWNGENEDDFPQICHYAFVLTIPSIKGNAPFTQPKVSAGGQVVEWSNQKKGTEPLYAMYGETLSLTSPEGTGNLQLHYSLTPDGSTAWRIDLRTQLVHDGKTHIYVNRFFEELEPTTDSEDSEPLEHRYYTLTYDWDDGSQEEYQFEVYVTPEPASDSWYSCAAVLKDQEFTFHSQENASWDVIVQAALRDLDQKIDAIAQASGRGISGTAPETMFAQNSGVVVRIRQSFDESFRNTSRLDLHIRKVQGGEYVYRVQSRVSHEEFGALLFSYWPNDEALPQQGAESYGKLLTSVTETAYDERLAICDLASYQVLAGDENDMAVAASYYMLKVKDYPDTDEDLVYLPAWEETFYLRLTKVNESGDYSVAAMSREDAVENLIGGGRPMVTVSKCWWPGKEVTLLDLQDAEEYSYPHSPAGPLEIFSSSESEVGLYDVPYLDGEHRLCLRYYNELYMLNQYWDLRYTPECVYQDLDGDGRRELGVIYHVGSGTGISVDEVHIYRFEGGGMSDRELNTERVILDHAPDFYTFTISEDGHAMEVVCGDETFSLHSEEYIYLDFRFPGEIAHFRFEDGQIAYELGGGSYSDALPLTFYVDYFTACGTVSFDALGFSLESVRLKSE